MGIQSSISMSKRTLLLLLLFIVVGISRAQYESSQSIASSPNAQGMKNLDIDLFRGKHRIDIPVFQFRTKHLDMPISLDYTPMDTQDNSSSLYYPGVTGLGWNLTCGGVVTRTINSSPDETASTGNFFNNDAGYDPIISKGQLSKHEAGEDEFEFNFCGYSGLFVFYRGKWLVLSDVDFTVSTKIVKNEVGDNELAEITLESPDGITYTFGGSNAIEYKQSESHTTGAKGKREATGWYLTRVESPEGDQINLEYQPSYAYWFPITKQTTVSTTATYNFLEQDNKRFFSETYPTDDAVQNQTEGYQLFGVRLYRISSPSNPTVVQFNTSAYPKTLLYHSGSPQDDKLDNIVLMKDFVVYKQFDMSYSFSPVLQLNSVTESAVSSGGASISLPPYQFFYLPKDHVTAPYVLNKIIYPTGGYSSFEFEHNGYAYIVAAGADNRKNIYPVQNENGNYVPYNQSPQSINEVTSFGTTVGFRIKKQVSKGSESDDAEVVRYYYTYQSPGISANQESGVLSKPLPSPTQFPGSLVGEKGDGFGSYVMTFPSDLYPQIYIPSLSGNNSIQERNGVGYSSVWVVRSVENSLGTNSSKGTEHYQFVNYAELRKREDYGSSQLYFTWVNRNEVGKLIKYERLDSHNNIEYSLYNQYVKGPEVMAKMFFVMNVPLLDPQNDKIVINNISKFYLDFYKYNLLRKIESDKGLETYTEYTYDSINNYLRETKLMEHKINYSTMPDLNANIDYANLSNTTYSYKYYSDFYDIGNDSVRYYDFRHVVKNAPVETIIRKDGQVVGAQFIKYTMFQSPRLFNILRPQQIYTLDISAPITDYVSPNFQWQVQDPRMKLKMTFDKYDRSNGNLLQFHAEGDTPTSILYDGNYSSVLMEARNCTYGQLDYGIDTNDIQNVKWLRTQLPNALITSYTYDYTFGRTSVTTPNGVTNYIEYDPFGRVKAIRDNNHNLLQVKEYNYNAQ